MSSSKISVELTDCGGLAWTKLAFEVWDDCFELMIPLARRIDRHPPAKTKRCFNAFCLKCRAFFKCKAPSARSAGSISLYLPVTETRHSFRIPNRAIGQRARTFSCRVLLRCSPAYQARLASSDNGLAAVPSHKSVRFLVGRHSHGTARPNPGIEARRGPVFCALPSSCLEIMSASAAELSMRDCSPISCCDG